MTLGKSPHCFEPQLPLLKSELRAPAGRVVSILSEVHKTEPGLSKVLRIRYLSSLNPNRVLSTADPSGKPYYSVV